METFHLLSWTSAISLNASVSFLSKCWHFQNCPPIKLQKVRFPSCQYQTATDNVLLTGLFFFPTDNLYELILDIYKSYHDTNPYHNFSHAVDVLQTTYYYLCQIGVLEPLYPSAFRARSRPACVSQLPVRDIIRPCDIFALLMASIGHDVGHPGVSNMFLVRPASRFLQDSPKKKNQHSPITLFLFRSILEPHWHYSTMIDQSWKVFTPWHFFIFWKSMV